MSEDLLLLGDDTETDSDELELEADEDAPLDADLPELCRYPTPPAPSWNSLMG